MLSFTRFALPVAFCTFSILGACLDALAQEDVAGRRIELKNGDKIIFFGDSLTSLAGEERPKEHVTKGYVRIVRETLQAKHPGKGIEVDWVATSGHTVPDLLKRVDADVLLRSPRSW